MENNGARGGWGREAADFCRFLAFSGCRVGEVPKVTWSCVDWDRRQVHLPGYKTESSDRYIPLFPDLEKLLRALIERRKSAARFAIDGKPFLDPTDSIFRIKEAQKTIDAAAASTGIKRVTHHDFRDMFATVCIESGVDIPTVARWLGHKDGGALLIKTYAHLRQEHSQAQAVKVSFGGAA
jgi:integrase